MKSINKWAIRLIGPLLLGILIVTMKVDLHKTQILLLSIKIEYFLIALFVIAPLSTMARAWRWNILLESYGIHYTFWETFKLFCIGLFISSFVPQGLGTFSKAIYLKADGYPLGKSTASILLDKGFNFIALMLVILVSFGYLILTYMTFWQFLTSCLLMVVLYILVTKLKHKTIDKTKRGLTYILEHINKWSRIDVSWLYKDFRKLTQNQGIVLMVISLLAISLDYLIYYLLILALSLHIPFLYFIALSSLVAIMQHIPISFNGIGTRETTMILVFAVLGETKESALAMSALILLWLLASNLLAGIAWMMRPLKLTPTPS